MLLPQRAQLLFHLLILAHQRSLQALTPPMPSCPSNLKATAFIVTQTMNVCVMTHHDEAVTT